MSSYLANMSTMRADDKSGHDRPRHQRSEKTLEKLKKNQPGDIVRIPMDNYSHYAIHIGELKKLDNINIIPFIIIL